ncbi:hypothetical protein C5E45_22255 [Nocardia nova]|uniref:Alpha/beta hydrolase n=1 Tax=Nocardia nova TaxID=37330 RepID=A0A2S6ALM6_9NOCA|nr:alpha/beta hydrolase [Nocardia nova]PPJ26953.1 hypothetical protein C5E41_16890 [Nocardia nova]PPJ36122.1 hypothetical protein C5E45_22255 [Nocardia nova]
MKLRAGEVDFHYVEHGTGRPVVVLHGAGVDHREAEACFERSLGDIAGLRRIYPDLPGTGYTTAPDTLFARCPHATLAVIDEAGHALPHEQPELLRALLAEWLTRVARAGERP